MVARVFPGPRRGRRSRTLGAPLAPSLASLAAYQVNANKWANIPYGVGSWIEQSQTMHLVLDVYKPTTAAPAAGYPVMFWFHPNGVTKTIAAGTDQATTKDEALAAGFVVISPDFRHPVVNVGEGAPHTDIGKAIQFGRSLARAFNLDTSNVFVLAQSRGSLAIWQSLQPDLRNTAAPTWSGRQSSLVKGIFAYNPQTTLSSTEIANRYVIEGERDDFLAAAPDDARWGSAIASAATAAQLPALALLTETAYHGSPQSAATVLANVHYPDFCSSLRDAYIARGQRANVADLDLHPTGEKFAGAVEWFKAVMDGATAKEAMAIALAKLNGGMLVYVRQDGTGAYSDDAATVPATPGQAAAVVANLGTGAAATQTVAEDRPTLIAYGGGYAVDFADTSDFLVTTKGSAATGTVIAAGQCGNGTFPAALLGNAPNATGTPGAVLRVPTNAGVQLRLTGSTGSASAAVAVTSANDPLVIEGWWDGANVYVAADGGAPGSIAQTVNPTSSTGYALGRHHASATGNPWKGAGSFWFACDPVLSDRKRRCIARCAAQILGKSYTD